MAISPLHQLWLLLVFLNLIFQILYFNNDQSRPLYLSKRITTPLLLFGAMALLILSSETPPFIPVLLLGLMGLGEIGIEGSSVVESRDGGRDASPVDKLLVTIAGVVFLAVNVILGLSLYPGKSVSLLVISLAVSLILLYLVNLFFAIKFKPDGDTRFQTRVYSAGLVILFSGALADLVSGLTVIGLAALILTLSDTLVLVRMAARFDKKENKGILFLFLLIILLLYYFYMAVLVSAGNPFGRGL